MRTAAALLTALLSLAGCSESGGGGEPRPTETPDPTPGGPGVQLAEVAGGFDLPILALPDPADGALLVVEQRGRVVRLDGGVVADLTDRVGSEGFEQGLLGAAFVPGHPDRIVLSYTDAAGDSVLSRFPLTGNGTDRRVDTAAEEVLMQVDQPFENHNGGHVAYGPDGMLYYALGDGGLAADPFQHGQDRSEVLGSILRLDVGPDGPVEIPQDNPFVGEPGAAPEIWAYGLRNPWRFSFDRETGDLWIADVGQDVWEEVNRQPAGSPGGENYGWNLFEGNHQYPLGVEVPADVAGLTFPVAEYSHDGTHCSVTGGFVYRGSQVPDLAGLYVYGDFCSGVVWTLAEDGAPEALMDTDHMVSSFGEGADGELYLVAHAGTLYRFVAD